MTMIPDFNSPEISTDVFLHFLSLVKHSAQTASSYCAEWGYPLFRFFSLSFHKCYLCANSEYLIIILSPTDSSKFLNISDLLYYQVFTQSLVESNFLNTFFQLQSSRKTIFISYSISSYFLNLLSEYYSFNSRQLAILFANPYSIILPNLRLINFVNEFDSISLANSNTHSFLSLPNDLPLHSKFFGHTLDFYINIPNSQIINI